MSRVELLDYRAGWVDDFARVRRDLLDAFAPLDVAVEHIGSTAVPGLAAKPVIDVLLGADRLADVEDRVTALAARGYAYVARYEAELPMRRYFVHDAARSPRVHVHAVERDSRFWREHLAFRDALRADVALRSGYLALKRRLAADHADDKAAYTASKAGFIRAALDAGAAAAAVPGS